MLWFFQPVQRLKFTRPKKMFGTHHHSGAGGFVVVSRLSMLCAFAGLSVSAAGSAFQWGVNGHPLSQSAYFDVPLATQVELVAATGAGWYRVDLSTNDFAASTARFDELLADAEKKGIQLLPVLISSAGDRSATAAPESIRAEAFAFARRVAGRYRGRITHWELGNELDAYALVRKGDRTRKGTLWQWGDPDGSDPDDYDEMRYQRAKDEILGLQEGVKASDPQAITIVDTAGWLHYGFVERLVNEDHVPFDILAWHWYSEMGDLTHVGGRFDLVAYLARFGKPLWLTEINLRNGSAAGRDRELAEFMTQAISKIGANPGIGGLFVYELLDEPYFGENGESHYGLVETARGVGGKWAVDRKKPAFDAYRSVIAARLALTGPAP
jgi:hypothetical protein